MSFTFVQGYFNLHSDPSVNFQLNRWISYLGMESFEEIRTIAPRLTNFSEYCAVFLQMAQEAEQAGKELNAAFYYRSAEFYIWVGDERKKTVRNKFLQLIRDYYHLSTKDIYQIPCDMGNKQIILPAYRFTPENPKDTLVIFGGSDSCMEEFLPILIPLSEIGFDIILFEGPGQGSVLMDQGVPMTPDWQLPVKAVLDYFGADNVTLMGISMGGCLVMRASAYEKRVSRVIAYDELYNANVWLDKMKPTVRALVSTCYSLHFRGIINSIFSSAMKKSMQMEWGMRQAMYLLGAKSPFEYMQKISRFRTDTASPLITQDVLVMAGTEDFGIPLKQFYQQIQALSNVRSLTARLFTREENAQNHCQIGNIKLALDTISNWIIFIKEHKPT